MDSEDTGLKDMFGDKIYTGYILKCRWGLVLVCKNEYGYYGSLICPIGHSCRNIPYSLDASEEDYVILYRPHDDTISRRELK